MINASTIGYMIDRGDELVVYCEQTELNGLRCPNKGVVDLDALAARLGREHSTLHEALFGKFRCTVCGSKVVSFRCNPRTTQGVNPYSKNANGW